MRTRYFALIWGIAFLVAGIAGFIPGLTTAEPAPHMVVAAGHGRLLGLFPVNVLHNAVHLIFGIWGLAAYRSFSGARTYARAVAVIYAVFAVMGLIPMLVAIRVTAERRRREAAAKEAGAASEGDKPPQPKKKKRGWFG